MTPRTRNLTAAAAMLTLAAWPHITTGAPAATGPPCGTRDAIVTYLDTAYGERPAGRGLRSDGLMVELLVGPQGSWTIILTHPRGLSCVASDGDDWEAIPGPRHEVVAPDAQ